MAGFALAVADLARWPFERAAWAVEQRLIWPLRERAAGWSPPRHAAGAGALAAIAAAAIVAGVLLLPGGGAPRERVAQPARVALAAPAARAEPAPERKTSGRTLRGPAPRFAVESGGVSVPKGWDGEGEAPAGAAPAAEPSAAQASGDDEPSTGAAAATSSAKRKPVPAGPAAMKAARRFSEAFVFYEIGQRRERAEQVFGETASPRLAAALGERAPRQPESAEIPKARVVNLVPGPRAGRAYTVSVSLLRVGLTSELRLELRKQDGKWVVTDVRG